jgi:hypothetical protein
MNFIYIKFIIIFLFKKKFVLINSPFQYINFFEYSKRYKRTHFDIPILIGFCEDNTANQIQSVNKILLLKNQKVFYLKKLFNIKFFHFLLYLKKKITGFDECIIGDINYYLFNEFYKYSQKNIILDDGTSSLEVFNKKYLKKDTKFFTLFKNQKDNISIKNNFFFLRKIKQKNQKKEKCVYILGTVLAVYKIISKKLLATFLRLICERYKNYKIYYVPHRLEKNLNFLRGKNIEIMRPSLPIELVIIFKEFIPKIIISFYSTSLFSLRLIYDKNIRLYNFNFSLNKILNKEFSSKYKLIQKQLFKHGIKNFR